MKYETMEYEKELDWPIFQKDLVQAFPGLRIVLTL